MTNVFIIQGVNREGAEVWYTGRAGAEFISTFCAEVFEFDSLEPAQARAANLNTMSALHGVSFTVRPLTVPRYGVAS